MTETAHVIAATAYPATGSPIVLKIIDSSATLDEGWSPYAQATLSIATPAIADYVRLDSRILQRVTVTLSQTIIPTTSRTLDLVLRGREMDRAEGTTTLTLASDESLLQDTGLIADAPIDVGNLVGTSLRALAGYALAMIGASFGDGLTAGVLFGKNMVVNPSGEYGEDGELARNYYKNPVFTDEVRYAAPGANTTLVAATAIVRNGTHSLRAEATAAAAIAVSFRDAGQATVDVDCETLPEHQVNYSCGVWVYVVGTARNMTMEIQKMRADGTDYDVPVLGVTQSVGAAWVLISAQIGLTRDEPWVQGFRVIVRSNTATAAQRFYFDDAAILVGNNAALTDEFSGATAASDGQTYSWKLAGTSDPLLGRYYGESLRTARIPYGYDRGTLNLVANPLDVPTQLYSSPTSPRDGTYTVRLRWRRPSAAYSAAYDLLLATIGEAIKPAASYAASAWVRTSRANRLILGVRWFNEAGATISTSSATAVAVTAATWTRLQLPALVAPAGAVDAKIVVGRDTLASGAVQYTNGDTIDFDGVMLSEQATVEAFFDGDTADAAGYAYSWRDEPGKSISLRNYDSTPIVEPDSAIWKPGVSAWDFMSPLVQQADYRLFCDESRVWRLVNDGYTVAGTIVLAEGADIKEASEALDRDGSLWFDAVVVEYTWTDAEGLTQTAYDTAYSPGWTKVERFTVDGAYPGAGAALAILNRALQLGSVIEASAVNRYDVQPAKAVQLTLSGFPMKSGRVAAVTWESPSNTMSVRSADLT